jgi:hypothetical protein
MVENGLIVEHGALQTQANHCLLGESRHDRLMRGEIMTVAPPDIIGRGEAKALGLKRYFTGKPCKRGHIAERGVSSQNCMECMRGHKRERRAANLEEAREAERERARRYRAADPERARENWRRWRDAHLELTKERDRGRKRLHYAKNKDRILGQQAAKRAATKDKISKRQAAKRKAADAGSKLNGAGLTGL